MQLWMLNVILRELGALYTPQETGLFKTSFKECAWSRTGKPPLKSPVDKNKYSGDLNDDNIQLTNYCKFVIQAMTWITKFWFIIQVMAWITYYSDKSAQVQVKLNCLYSAAPKSTQRYSRPGFGIPDCTKFLDDFWAITRSQQYNLNYFGALVFGPWFQFFVQNFGAIQKHNFGTLVSAYEPAHYLFMLSLRSLIF